MTLAISSLSIDIATINVMRRSMSGVLMTGAIRLRSRMRWKLSCPVLEAGRREQSLLPSYHIRYLDMHRLENVTMVYCISILENFSRAVLASAISLRQDTEAFLAVFYKAVRTYGIPEVLVSDNGSVFTSHDTRRVCEQLGIEKKEIKKGRPWQNYIETMLYVQRRMADWSFEKAQTWEDLLERRSRNATLGYRMVSADAH